MEQELRSVWLTFLAVTILVVVLAIQIVRLEHRVDKLERACGPVDTGGGVTQCAQPNVVQAPPKS